MNRTLTLVFETIHFLALALWIGAQATVLVLFSSGGVPALFMQRERALVELWGLIMVAVQWLIRRRFSGSRKLYLMDGVRALLTFTALFAGEYIKYSSGASKTLSITSAIIQKSGGEMVLIGAQIGLLAGVCAMSIDLLMRPMVPAPARSAEPIKTAANTKAAFVKPPRGTKKR